ncbi:MAG: 50S ribosomal protein L11 methyltransferase [Armatimonadota bacterium]|nr:50S ribosomal protein L11 methyltransferase [Armatimonadota bacterium]
MGAPAAERIWVRVTVRCPPQAEDAASSALLPLSPNGIVSEGSDPVCLTAWLGPHLAAERDVAQEAEGAAFDALAAIPEELLPRPLRLEAEAVPERDWIASFRAQHRPVRIGRIVIKPTWEAWPTPSLPPRDNDLLVELDPGLAFGTGLHPTTRICLVEMQQRLRRGDRVIDLGTGSGIVAIAAAKLGAGEVLALERDASAAAVARENVRRNEVAERVVVCEMDGLAGVEPGWDAVVANIAPGVVAREAPAAARVLRPGGVYICTGVPLSREDEVLEALRSARFQGVVPRISGDWVGYVCMTPG